MRGKLQLSTAELRQGNMRDSSEAEGKRGGGGEHTAVSDRQKESESLRMWLEKQEGDNMKD